MAVLDDAVASLQAVQTDDADVQAKVAAALTAVQAAQAGETVDPNDALVAAIVAAFVAAGYTVTPPAPVVPEIPAVA
jgi:hypothetical protein